MSVEPASERLTKADVLHARDVAELLTVPISTVHEWARTGRLPSRKRGRLALNPDRAFGPEEAAHVRRGANATLLLDLGRLDIVQRLPGLAGWDQLNATAEEYALEGLELRIVDRHTLMRRKRDRSTPQDLADVAAIERLPD